MQEIYKLNPSFIFSTKNDVTRVVSMEDGDSELLVLNGASAHVLNYFDGKSSLEDVRLGLQKIVSAKITNEDFMKLINFLKERKIIEA